MNQKSRAGYCVENLTPDLQDWKIQLRGIVKRSESDVPGMVNGRGNELICGLFRGQGGSSWAEGPQGVEWEQLFGEKLLATGGDHVMGDEDVVHRAQPAGTRILNAGDVNGGGFEGSE